MNVREYQKLKQEVDNLKAELARLDGKEESILTRLESEFGFSSLEKAEQELTKLEKELNRDQKKYEAELTTWREKWKDV